ncbi:phosphoadenylylsulfate reductase (thioredoxin) [Nakamurella panacisegetis]|uniref:Adenosine 5'-phosphosulfate reductase n=1 Tax=Nakamurella panacisegetis TaxID=1090615 RepID=A0A1H0ICW1_9ACTN|nr:phosphoadenylyl-sulfate reductase [Nakamurella panacisegetis]SDO29277.1 phosphoadenylylsulfate reductase (thioredoxin) [Nakamurella panacisegetis]
MITTVRSPEDLAAVAARGATDLEGATAREILGWAAEEFGDGLAVTASMQDTVLAHLAAQVKPGIDVLFLETGYHFIETIGTADAVEAVYDITLRRLLPLQTVAEQDAQYGPDLFSRNPDLCCALRKVAPLNAAMSGYDAWATGLRRAESAARADTPVVSFDVKRGRVKIAPLAAWSDEDVDRYIVENNVLVNPLLSNEYPSIGCEPCTRRVAPGEDARAGRWAGLTKTECGLHT